MKNIIQNLWNKIWLPKPSEFKEGADDALPMECITPNTGEYTWEKFEEEVKQKYPIRFFFFKTVRSWYRVNIYMPIDHAFYFLNSHLNPKRRYHMLDLRQPKIENNDSYRWGWIDADKKILYAIFNILVDFVEKELPYIYHPTDEDCKNDSSYKIQRDFINEVNEIYSWWKAEQKKDPLLTSYDEEKMSEKENEMILRVIKIRKFLWS